MTNVLSLNTKDIWERSEIDILVASLKISMLGSSIYDMFQILDKNGTTLCFVDLGNTLIYIFYFITNKLVGILDWKFNVLPYLTKVNNLHLLQNKSITVRCLSGIDRK